jgi:carbon monoxide dehydrogenase subunit G
MEIQGTHQFKAPLSKVWDALMDPAVLAKALPGGDQLEQVGENDYKAAMNVKVGPVQGRFDGKVTISDVVPQQSYHMVVSGSGTPGFLNGEGSLSLAENDEGTLLTYSGDVQVGGRIATVGQRLIDSTAKSIIRQGLKTLDEQLLNGGTAPAAPVTPEEMVTASSAATEGTSPAGDTASARVAAAPTPSQQSTSASEMGNIAVDVVKDVVQDLASDYIPREKQPQVFAFILGALAMLLFVVLVRLVQRD